MTRRAVVAAALLTQILAAAACDSGPTSPNARITLVLPATVTGRIVTCATCTDPSVWGVVEQDVSIVNRSGRSRDVATVEAQAFNQTRGTLIKSNSRPNVDHTYGNTHLAPGSTLTLEAGLVYFPLPPPADDIRFIVIVTFRDGTSTRGETRLLTGA